MCAGGSRRRGEKFDYSAVCDFLRPINTHREGVENIEVRLIDDFSWEQPLARKPFHFVKVKWRVCLGDN